MALVGDNKAIPFEVALIQTEVANFWRAARTLKLCNPETHLDFDNYRLVMFHHDLVTDTAGENPTTIVRPCSVFGVMTLSRYRELYLDDAGKHKEGFKDTLPQLSDLAQYICLFDLNFDAKDPVSFLDTKQLTRERTFQYCRKMLGVEKLQFLSFQRRLINDFAAKIIMTICKLDFPTDASTAAATQDLLGRFTKQ